MTLLAFCWRLTKMLFVKYSLLFLLSTQVVHAFTKKECLDSSFNDEMVKQELYFGILEKTVFINKSGCVIQIKDKTIMERNWEIDVCREPIHIKVEEHGDHSVYKRKKLCEKGDQTKFCTVWDTLKEEVLDYSLIYAAGEREKLDTNHGKTYCSYELIKEYLIQGVVFSKYRPINANEEKAVKMMKLEADTIKPDSVLENEVLSVDDKKPEPSEASEKPGQESEIKF